MHTPTDSPPMEISKNTFVVTFKGKQNKLMKHIFISLKGISTVWAEANFRNNMHIAIVICFPCIFQLRIEKNHF